MLPISVLDLVPVRAGETPSHALKQALELARCVEACGYTRYWVAEHHNMVGVASSATAVVIGHLAAGTRTIRVGSGGVMLPNHAPLVIAEQFGTLAALHPGRIDLGLGRAPGTDGATMRALRVDPQAAEHFPEDIEQLRMLFDEPVPGQTVRAVPGAGLKVPLWILGSSLYGAQVAAWFGLPYAFASHFAPDALDAALRVYRERFQPSAQQARPHAMPCVNVIVAETDARAQHLFTSAQQRFIDLVRNRRGLLPPPIEDIQSYGSPQEYAQAMRMLSCSFVGSPETVHAALQRFLERTAADELMVSTAVFDPVARQASYRLLAEVARSLRPVAWSQDVASVS